MASCNRRHLPSWRELQASQHGSPERLDSLRCAAPAFVLCAVCRSRRRLWNSIPFRPPRTRKSLNVIVNTGGCEVRLAAGKCDTLRARKPLMDERQDYRFFWIVVFTLLLLTRIPAMASYLSIDNV